MDSVVAGTARSGVSFPSHSSRGPSFNKKKLNQIMLEFETILQHRNMYTHEAAVSLSARTFLIGDV